MIARVVLTRKCNRKCEGCSNDHPIFETHTKVGSINDVLALNPTAIVLTGGEPMMRSQIVNTIRTMQAIADKGISIVLYSATYDPVLSESWVYAMSLLDGLSFTLHDGFNDRDITGVIELTKLVKLYASNVDSRLNIDGRISDEALSSCGDLSAWRKVRKLEWRDECTLPVGEQLFVVGGE